jgi:hypothetical protein
MYRHRKGSNSYNTGFKQGFQRMKSIGGPRRGIGAAVVYQMYMFEKEGYVHQSVYPVKIGIVQKKQPAKRKQVIPNTYRIEWRFYKIIVGFQQYNNHIGHGSKNENTHQAVQ